MIKINWNLHWFCSTSIFSWLISLKKLCQILNPSVGHVKQKHHDCDSKGEGEIGESELCQLKLSPGLFSDSLVTSQVPHSV